MSHWKTSSECYLEIGQSSLRALCGDDGLELPLERLPTGRLTANCKQNISLSLEGFFRRKGWQRSRVFCAVSARGVSLRRIGLPHTSKDNLNRVLLLQLENEFPVSPDELAWGYRPLEEAKQPGNGSTGQQQFLIAAVRKEVVGEYAEILTACGVHPHFAVAALAREAICPPMPATHSILDIGRHYSELVSFENGVPTAVRTFAWGGENITHSIEQRAEISHDEAEKLKIRLGDSALVDDHSTTTARAAVETALDSLAQFLKGQSLGDKLYLTGRSARMKDLARGLTERLALATKCEALEPEPMAGHSAAILGLRAATERGDGASVLFLLAKPSNGSSSLTQPAPWKWVSVAVSLALVLLLLPYAEALVLKPYVAKRLAAIKADRGRLTMIDAEWNFLQYLRQNQPPYLDALYLIAKCAPPGAKLEALSMNHRGDISIRASMQNSQQVTDFRSKLIESGFFEHLTLEEQSPAMGQPKMNVRMSGAWKPLSARQMLALGPTPEEIEKAKTRPRNPQPGMPPMMGMPPMGMPSPGMGGPAGPGIGSARRSRTGTPVGPRPGAMPPGAVPSGPQPSGAIPPGALPPGVVIPQPQ